MIDEKEIIVLTGVRYGGKTTLLRKLTKKLIERGMKPLRPWKGGVSLRKTVSFSPHSSPPMERRGFLRGEINPINILYLDFDDLLVERYIQLGAKLPEKNYKVYSCRLA